ncbi:MAG: calcium/sodium antiporter [Pirellulaceae bacterium]
MRYCKVLVVVAGWTSLNKYRPVQHVESNLMDLGWPTIQIIVGLVILLIGGDILVRGASGLAVIARISPLVIGLTVVSFGTSAPELAVSLQSSYQDSAELAIGNALGSNLFNILVVLGLAAIVTPLAVSSELFRRDLWWMLLSCLALIPIGQDGYISRLEGGLLASALIVYVVWLIRSSRRVTREVKEDLTDDLPKVSYNLANVFKFLGFLVFGLALLVFGSKWLTEGAVSIAKSFGVSELVIGLTIVAVGTSLPEVITSIMAGLKGEKDIAVGNVVGSNIFNVLCVLGFSGLFAKTTLPFPSVALHFDLPVVIAVSAVCLPVFLIGRTVTRVNGILFVLIYVIYTCYLIFQAQQSDIASTFKSIFFFVVVPAFVITLITEFLVFSRPRNDVSNAKTE